MRDLAGLSRLQHDARCRQRERRWVRLGCARQAPDAGERTCQVDVRLARAATSSPSSALAVELVDGARVNGYQPRALPPARTELAVVKDMLNDRHMFSEGLPPSVLPGHECGISKTATTPCLTKQ